MKTQVRKSVFETNSSSMHSLTVTRRKPDLKQSEDMEPITVGLGEYGWGYETLDWWMEKADYLGVECTTTRYRKDEETGEYGYETFLSEDNIERRNILKAALRMRFSNVEIIFKTEGYIDHQSSGDIWDIIMGDKHPVSKCHEIIFGDARIIIDNDNH